jgi:hypothetical protein
MAVRTVQRTSSMIGVCAITLLISAGALGASTHHGGAVQEFTPSRAELRTREVWVDRDFNFQLKIRCAPRGASFPCEGRTYVETIRLPLYGSGYPMTPPFRGYKVGRGMQRSLAFHLRIGQATLKRRGKLWVRSYVSVRNGGYSVTSPVLLRWRQLQGRA